MRTTAVAFCLVIAFGAIVSAQDQFEPDNSLKAARAINFDHTESHTLPKGDQDWFKLTAPAAGIVRVIIDDWNKEDFKQDTPYIKFYSSSGRSFREWRNDAMYPKGDLYVSIAEHWDSRKVQGSDKPFKVTFTFEPETDPSEPNNSRSSARVLKFDEVVEARLVPWNDVDYFRLDVPQTGIVRLNVEGWDADAYKKKYQYVRFFTSSNTAIRQWRHDVLVTEGPLYCAIQEHWDDSKVVGADAPFKVSFSFEPETDSSEPNGSIKTARPTKFDETITARLVPWDDVDTYRLDLPAPGLVKVKIDDWDVEAFKKKTPYIIFKNKSGKNLREWQDDIITDAGPLYVVIREHWDDSKVTGAASPFKVTFTFEEVADPTEPNDSVAQARPVKLSEPIDMQLTPIKDVDYVKIDVPKTGIITWQTNNWDRSKTGHAAPYVIFVDKAGKQFVGESPDLRSDAGAVYAFVKEHWSSSELKGVEDTFQIIFSWTPDPDSTEPVNNTIRGAKQVEIGKPFTAQIVPSYDADHVKFTLDTKTTIKFEQLKGPAKVRPFIWYLDNDGKRKFSRYADAKATLEAGDHYVAVHANRHPGGVVEPFTLQFTATDAPPVVVENEEPKSSNVQRWIFNVERTE